MIKLEKKLTEAFNNVQSTALSQNTDWRTAAYNIAIKRIETAYTERGIFP